MLDPTPPTLLGLAWALQRKTAVSPSLSLVGECCSRSQGANSTITSTEADLGHRKLGIWQSSLAGYYLAVTSAEFTAEQLMLVLW